MTSAILALAICAMSVTAPLQAIFDKLAGGSDSYHAGELQAAVTTSPQLVRQLQALASTGALQAIEIGPLESRVFAASHNNGVIILTPKFIDDQTPLGGGDAALREEIGARDLVFVLGYLASKVETAPAQSAAQARSLAAIKALADRTPRGGSIDGDPFLKASLAAKLDFEAMAYLAGWNDEADAAATAKGAPLTPEEAVRLLREGRNTRVLLAAATLPEGGRLIPTNSLQFLPTRHNLDAMVQVLRTAQVPDFN